MPVRSRAGARLPSDCPSLWPAHAEERLGQAFAECGDLLLKTVRWRRFLSIFASEAEFHGACRVPAPRCSHIVCDLFDLFTPVLTQALVRRQFAGT